VCRTGNEKANEPRDFLGPLRNPLVAWGIGQRKVVSNNSFPCWKTGLAGCSNGKNTLAARPRSGVRPGSRARKEHLSSPMLLVKKCLQFCKICVEGLACAGKIARGNLARAAGSGGGPAVGCRRGSNRIA
jgi:hypothetical protein